MTWLYNNSSTFGLVGCIRVKLSLNAGENVLLFIFEAFLEDNGDSFGEFMATMSDLYFLVLMSLNLLVLVIEFVVFLIIK